MVRSKLLIGLSAALIAFGAASTSAQAEVFPYTGAEQTYVVPDDATSLQIVARGGKGGDAETATGGLGAQVTATVPVTGGQVLYVLVGENGAADPLGAAAFNGGGAAGDLFVIGGGSAGGGASDVRTCSTAATCPALGTPGDPRLVVAGGGGGAGGDANGTGGDGGDAAPTAGAGGGGLDSGTALGGGGGDGATSSTGGSAGTGGGGGNPDGFPGFAGVAAIGGKGGSNGGSAGGGGGGGGLFGGGGGGQGGRNINGLRGGGGGGGAGSSYVIPAGTGVSTVPNSSGLPSVEITVASTTPPPPPVGAPDTTITFRSTARRSSKARFRFASTVADSTFTCTIDRRRPAPCTSPVVYKRLQRGPHAFAVFATSPQGVADTTPAVASFKTRKKPRKNKG